MEFEILMQYYKELTGALKYFIHRLCLELQDAEIITPDDDKYFIISHFYKSEVIILTRIAHHLLSGKTNLFYKFLEIIQNDKDCNCQYLVNKIQAEILSLDQKMLIGMLMVV